jgi:hypothetical protein
MYKCILSKSAASIIFCISFSVGFCPMALMTQPNSSTDMVLSPSLSNWLNAPRRSKKTLMEYQLFHVLPRDA